jgi:hypothetical protein
LQFWTANQLLGLVRSILGHLAVKQADVFALFPATIGLFADVAEVPNDNGYSRQ